MRKTKKYWTAHMQTNKPTSKDLMWHVAIGQGQKGIREGDARERILQPCLTQNFITRQNPFSTLKI